DIKSFLANKVPNSHKGKCWLFCFHKRLQIQLKDGTFDDDGIINFLRPLKRYNQLYFDYILRLFSTCAEKAAIDDDPCIYSSNFFNCVLEEAE
ncbi:PBP GOBP domain containing protein, partial [Asbolus verrucosus]